RNNKIQLVSFNQLESVFAFLGFMGAKSLATFLRIKFYSWEALAAIARPVSPAPKVSTREKLPYLILLLIAAVAAVAAIFGHHGGLAAMMVFPPLLDQALLKFSKALYGGDELAAEEPL